MARGSVYLIGSGQGGTLSTVVKRALEGAKRSGKRPRVAASYAAMHHSTSGLSFMVSTAAKVFGVDVERFFVPGEQGTAADTDGRAIVERADVIFVSGGDPVAGAELFTSSGADAWLREARERGTALGGVSAGSMMLCAFWASWPDEPDASAPFDGGALVPCTGVVPNLVIDCHAEEEGWSELKIVRQMLLAKGGGSVGVRTIGVPSGGAGVVDADGRLEDVGRPSFTLT